MKKIFLVSLCVLLAASVALAKETPKEKPAMKQMRLTQEEFLPKDGMIPRAPAQDDTTWLGVFTFDAGPSCDDEGWVEADMGFQTKDYWHVDDFGGLGGGAVGNLVPIGGAQSMWCGTRPDSTGDLDLCGYRTAPGYGNSWLQNFCTIDCLVPQVGSAVWLDFDAAWHSEPNYDWTNIQISDGCGISWETIVNGKGVYDGLGTASAQSVRIDPADFPSGSLKIRFQFTSDGAWSDYDGNYPSDGGFILDNVIVYDTTGTSPALVAMEDFEDEAWGDKDADDWETCNLPGYGSQGFMFPALQMVQEDPCDQNFSCVWGFFETSTYDYTCGGWPGQRVVPYGDALDQYISSFIWSPAMPVPTDPGSVWELRWQTYRDLLIPPLVFYDFYIRSWTGDPPDCPGAWVGDIYVYYGPNKDWHETAPDDRPIGQFIEGGATAVQVALGARDMCGVWGGIYGDCSCHSHSPVFDNVWVYNVAAQGPQWNIVEVNYLQDTFPSSAGITGPGRIDMANDIVQDANLSHIQPGDSMTLSVTDPEAGIGFHVDGDTSSMAAVYCYVSVDGPHSAEAPTSFPMAGWLDDPRYTYRGSVAAGGRNWAQIQMDTCYTDDGIPIEDRYAIDLNDNLFTPGDSIYYFFGAKNGNGAWTWNSYRIPGPNTVFDIEPAASYPDEVNVLPALGRDVGDGGVGGDILYVDGMDDRGGQVWFDTAFQLLGIYDEIDRYDVIAPSSGLANHPSVRCSDISSQVLGIYRKIIWNAGYLPGLFNDGETFGKSDDMTFAYNFLQGLELPGGIYLNGDTPAEDWDGMTSTAATTLRNVYMNFLLTSDDHKDYVNISPWGIGVSGGIFEDATTTPARPDTLICFGGCPLIKDFDVLGVQGDAVVQMNYHQNSASGNGLGPVGSTVSQVHNNGTVDVGFILEGFGFQYIRDDRPAGIPDNVWHLFRVIEWLGNPLNDPVSARPTDVSINELRQNRPNPFNPSTTIEFQVKNTGPVSLKIYNVAGQLVKTLADNEQFTAGTLHARPWNGLNDAGQQVSSGVYFYKLVTNDFTMTKKMILLK